MKWNQTKMTLSQSEYNDIINDPTKTITGDIAWEGMPNALARRFRIDIESFEGYPVFVQGWTNFSSGKLSYTIVHRAVGRIYGLDLGAEHKNPDGESVGEKHKNYWVPGSRDKWAYVPDDITADWDSPVEAWEQFCLEAQITHTGSMIPPAFQSRMPL